MMDFKPMNKGFQFFEQEIISRNNLHDKLITSYRKVMPSSKDYGGISFVMEYNNDIDKLELILNFNDLVDLYVGNEKSYKNLHIRDVRQVLDQFEYRAKLMFVGTIPIHEEE